MALRFSVEQGIATLTLNRPAQLNAINGEMRWRLLESWRRVEEDPAIAIAILTGAGSRAFCAGADLRRQAERHRERDPRVEKVGPSGITPRQSGVTKPVICAINGVCAGGALQFVSDCDVVIASESAEFMNPGVSMGLIAPYGPIVLLRKISAEAVFRMTLGGSAARISAQRALQLGLVSAVVPSDRLAKEAKRLAESIRDSHVNALAEIKAAAWTTLAGMPGRFRSR